MPELISANLPSAHQVSRTVLDDAPAAIGWSACGRWLAAATTSGVIHLIDARTGSQHTA
jgi:hypothetical protein